MKSVSFTASVKWFSLQGECATMRPNYSLSIKGQEKASRVLGDKGF